MTFNVSGHARIEVRGSEVICRRNSKVSGTVRIVTGKKVGSGLVTRRSNMGAVLV